MNPLFEDFRLDLEAMRRILVLVERTSAFRAVALGPTDGWDASAAASLTDLHCAADAAAAELPIMNGVLLLFLAGRFENYVRDLFEDLCDTVAGKCPEFQHLPREMRENLILYTAIVMQSPRKYGHASNGVHAFVSTMADNMNGRPLRGVNSKCLSVTTENMWPDTLNDLFRRVGAKDVIARVGQQAAVQQFFGVDQPDKATSDTRAFLTSFMTLRNQIAHPSTAITFPGVEDVRRHLDFCETIGRALADVSGVLGTTLGEQSPTAVKTTEAVPVQVPPDSRRAECVRSSDSAAE